MNEFPSMELALNVKWDKKWLCEWNETSTSHEIEWTEWSDTIGTKQFGDGLEN